MVLRGSKTKPDHEIQDITQLIASTQEDLELISSQLEGARAGLEEQLEQFTVGIQTDEFGSYPPGITQDVADELRRIESGEGRRTTHDVLRQAGKRHKDQMERNRHNMEMLMSMKQVLDSIRQLEQLRGEKRQTLTAAQNTMIVTAKQFLCGGLAGCTARSVVAPIDRVKLLIQTSRVVNQHAARVAMEAVGVAAGKVTLQTAPIEHSGVIRTFNHILRTEGWQSLWRGNGTNCIRVFPYAATQFISYEKYRGLVMDLTPGDFGVQHRLLAGGMAGATAASLTHPLDVTRVRLAVHKELKGMRHCWKDIYAEGGVRGFYKGYAPTMLSLSPFIAVNFATFDTLKSWYYPDASKPQSKAVILGLGASAGLIAQTVCYPLDTIRRRMQLKGTNYTSIRNAFATIFKTEGMGGFYKGLAPNALKVVPNNGLRFLAYTYLTQVMEVPPRKKR